MKVEQLKTLFIDPPDAYRPIPLFRINDEVDRTELNRQIRSLREQGCGGIFSLCELFNDGAPQKFLSDWWWKVVRWLAEGCIEQGLEFWVYDDEDWPSGSAGGRIPEEYPELNWKYLKVQNKKVKGPRNLELAIESDSIVGALAYQLRNQKVVIESILDITDHVSQGKLTWDVPSGVWTIAIYQASPGKGFFIDVYGDLMSSRFGDVFVDWVYKSHWEKTKDLKGLQFKGYFTDEPALSLSLIEWGERFDWYPSMPFTPELPEAFEKRYGYSWRHNLPLLYEEHGKESLRFRCHHWETCCYLYRENYFGKIYRFCEEKGLLASGHLVVEENFQNHLAQQGGNLPSHFRYMHIPGIDWIHPFENFKNLPATTPKYATSMAHLKGRDRIWCESFAASGWGLTFQEMRRIVNWEHINGINMQIPITYKYSQRGPKRTQFYPGGITYQQPYWDHFKAFADYEGRMCALVGGEGHVAQVALLYPSVDIWAHCWERSLLESRSEEYNQLGDRIRGTGFDFDILDDEAILEECRIENGLLQTPTEKFEVLIIPRMDAIRRQTMERCLEFVQAGGKLIFLGQLPRHSFESGSKDPRLMALIKQLLGSSCHKSAGQGRCINRKVGKGIAAFAPEIGAVLDSLKELTVPDVQTTTSIYEFYHYHRRLEDGDLYLLFNRWDEKRTIEVLLKEKGTPERWNPETGEVTPVLDYQVTSSGTRMKLEYHPQETIVMMLRHGQSQVSKPKRFDLVKEIEVKGLFRFHIEETMKRPHLAWNFTQVQDGWKSCSPPMVVPHEIPLGDWCQYGLASFSGLGHYEKEFVLENLPQNGKVVLDLGKVAISAEVRVNGDKAGIVFFEPYQLDITQWVKAGSNQLKISVANTLSNYFAQFEELAALPFNQGGDRPDRRVSGLVGPVTLRIYRCDEVLT